MEGHQGLGEEGYGITTPNNSDKERLNTMTIAL